MGQEEKRIMREYPDAKKHIEKYMSDAVEHYMNGLKQRGLQPNPTLDRIFIERTMKETEDSYMQELAEVHAHNIGVINDSYAKRLKKIRRSGDWLAILICIPAAILFELLAWYDFTHHAGSDGILSATIGLAWLALIVLKRCFDR
jgi:hypothetical protein